MIVLLPGAKPVIPENPTEEPTGFSSSCVTLIILCSGNNLD